MDKISKALKKFSPKERKNIETILQKIKNNNLANFDLKKLKGHDNIFRIRKGKIRIIYQLRLNELYIITIERRNDKTYNNF